MKPAGGVTAAIYAEQIDAVYRQMPIALAVNIVNAAVAAIALAPFATRPVLPPWFASVALVTIIRLLLWLHYRRASVPLENIQRHARLATSSSLLAGLTWGIGGAVLFPVVPVPGQIFLTMVIGGMCAGSVVVNASHLPTLLAFLIAATLPMAARFLADDSTTDQALGAMIVVFAAALSLAGRYLSRFFLQTIQLRFELSEANQRLQAEIAEHRAAEAALRQAQKLEAVGQLTGGIAHDFNNLLTVVIGNLELANARAGDTSMSPFLNAALQSAQRGVALIQRLLAFARKQNLDPRSVNLAALVTGVEEMLRRTLGPQISLVISSGPDLAPAHVDANQVELAILNLAINARDAMPGGGTVRITIRNGREGQDAPPELARGEYVVLAISDDGTGMDEATLVRAFDPFFTTKQIGSGSGLGLSMVQGFAVQSGGAVRILSKLGEGTTVELWLPRADRPAGAQTFDRYRLRIAAGAASVLLCDDDHAVRRVLADYLETIGHAVHQAGDAQAALRFLEGDARVDLFIVDYGMPGMDGLETIRQARLRRPDLRSLLITGHAGIRSGAGLPVLHKPFALDDLGRRVAEASAA